MLDSKLKGVTRKTRSLRLALALALLSIITAAYVFVYSMADEILAMMG